MQEKEQQLPFEDAMKQFLQTYAQEQFGANADGEELMERAREEMEGFRRLMTYYKCAIMEVQTKFQVLSEEASLTYDRNPIESIKSRLKSVDSIREKLRRKGLPFTSASIERNIHDVAGLRIICSFPEDIYLVRGWLLEQDDIRLIEEKDYIRHPKDNGYRSLHLIVEVPIFLQKEKRPMRVEVQFRTIAMDFWASLEHKLKYKKNVAGADITEQLRQCAEESAALDLRMEAIRQQIEQIPANN